MDDVFCEENRRWAYENHLPGSTTVRERWHRDGYRRVEQDWTRQFAEARGWRVSKTEFSLAQLREGRMARRRSDYVEEGMRGGIVDHPAWLRHPGGRPAAILSHSYAPVQTILDAAAAHGLDCEILPWSWYYPGNATAVLFTP